MEQLEGKPKTEKEIILETLVGLGIIPKVEDDIDGLTPIWIQFENQSNGYLFNKNTYYFEGESLKRVKYESFFKVENV